MCSMPSSRAGAISEDADPAEREPLRKRDLRDRLGDRLEVVTRQDHRRLLQRHGSMKCSGPLACPPRRSLASCVVSWCPPTIGLCGSARIRILHGREIRRARPRVEIFEHRVVARARLELGDAAVGIVDVAEDDRLGRAHRLAGRHDFAVANVAIFALRLDARGVDALHAVGALLHDAAAADGDVGVALQLELRRVPVLDTAGS